MLPQWPYMCSCCRKPLCGRVFQLAHSHYIDSGRKAAGQSLAAAGLGGKEEYDRLVEMADSIVDSGKADDGGPMEMLLSLLCERIEQHDKEQFVVPNSPPTQVVRFLHGARRSDTKPSPGDWKPKRGYDLLTWALILLELAVLQAARRPTSTKTRAIKIHAVSLISVRTRQ